MPNQESPCYLVISPKLRHSLREWIKDHKTQEANETLEAQEAQKVMIQRLLPPVT